MCISIYIYMYETLNLRMF